MVPVVPVFGTRH